jgi:hypothetical protein
MIAAALLALIGASLLSTMAFSSRSASTTRARSVASGEANRVIDQLVILMQIASAKSTDVNRFCDLVKASGGPMEGATGTCPDLTVTNKAIVNSSLKADIAIASTTIGSKNGLTASVTVSGGQLSANEKVTVNTLLRR